MALFRVRLPTLQIEDVKDVDESLQQDLRKVLLCVY